MNSLRSLTDSSLAIEAQGLVYHYADHKALDGLSLSIEPGEVFGLLGPNGSGKTTLFRLLSTLIRLQQGTLSVFGHSLPAESSLVRAQLGVVFQNPSCDRKLTVRENLQCQAALFGIVGRDRLDRIDAVTNDLGIADRLDWQVEKLSGGLERRVDIAKSMLHAPRLLLLDEPSTGLDPSARIDLWHALNALRERHGVTLLLTTHLLDEAEKAQRIGIMHQGKLVALGRPEQLRRELGDRVLLVDARDPARVVEWLKARALQADVQQNQLRISCSDSAQWIAPMVADLGEVVRSISLAEPSLEDVFVARTGHRFWDSPASVDSHKPARKRR